MVLTYPVTMFGRFTNLGDYVGTFTCFDSKGKRRSAYLGAFLPELGTTYPVPTVVTETLSDFGKPTETDDLVQHMGNENAVEHRKIDGSFSIMPRLDLKYASQDGWKYVDTASTIEVMYAGTWTRLPCTLISRSGSWWYALVPLTEYNTSYDGRTVHFAFGVTFCSNHEATCAVFFWMKGGYRNPSCRVVCQKPFVSNPTGSDGYVYERSWYAAADFPDYAHISMDELAWRGSFTKTLRSAIHFQSHVGSESVRDYAIRMIRRCLDDCVDALVPDHPDLDVWGELANTCTGAAKATSSNVLSTANETVHTCEGVTDLLESVAALKTAKPKKFLKAIGNLRLAWKWGVPLTVKDAHEIADGLGDKVITDRLYTNPDRIHVQHAHRREDFHPSEKHTDFTGATAHCDYWLKILYKDNNTAKQQAGAKLAADLNLVTLENGWDVVPYSFVIDWLTDFGSVLNAADNVMYRTAYWDIVGSVRGTKRIYEVESSAFAKYDSTIRGSCSYQIYMRRVFPDTIPLPTLGYLNPSIGMTQWLDGATLISQICE